MAGVNEILGSLLGGGGTQSPASGVQQLLQPVVELIQNNGGLQNLLTQLQNSPVAEQAGSWIGSGPNLPASAEDIAAAVGLDNVKQMAAQSGLSVDQVSSGLSQLLPELINRLTPGGQIPSLDQLGGLAAQIPGGQQIQQQATDVLSRILGGK